ncbi:hypothetical protein TNCV_1430171 [Trichonephila clavipes]|nr:hypothetical protein TNCV_1430171 [Trichonephila clavipes]
MWFSHFRHGQRGMNMNPYTNAKLVDILFIYGLANGNGRVAVRLHGGRYPKRWQPNHQTFDKVHQNLAEHGPFRVTIDNTPVSSEIRPGGTNIHHCCNYSCNTMYLQTCPQVHVAFVSCVHTCQWQQFQTSPGML